MIKNLRKQLSSLVIYAVFVAYVGPYFLLPLIRIDSVPLKSLPISYWLVICLLLILTGFVLVAILRLTAPGRRKMPGWLPFRIMISTIFFAGTAFLGLSDLPDRGWTGRTFYSAMLGTIILVAGITAYFKLRIIQYQSETAEEESQQDDSGIQTEVTDSSIIEQQDSSSNA